MERRLIVEFEDTIERLLDALRPDTLGPATDVVEAYLDMRGFGPVKDTAVAEARERIAGLLANLEQSERQAA
jgi:indolepyruvate ferredoxin oxidoreductase